MVKLQPIAAMSHNFQQRKRSQLDPQQCLASNIHIQHTIAKTLPIYYLSGFPKPLQCTLFTTSANT